LFSYLQRELGPFLPFLLIGLVWDFPGWGYIGLELAGLAAYFLLHEKGAFITWLKSLQGLIYLVLYHLILGIHISHEVTQVSHLDFVLGITLGICVLGWLAKRFYRADPGRHGKVAGCVVNATKAIMLLMIVNSLAIMALMGSMTILADMMKGYGWSLLAVADGSFLVLGSLMQSRTQEGENPSDRGN
jgi:hypothetical protein